MRPLLTPEAAAIVREAAHVTEASESAAASHLIIAGHRSHEPIPGSGRAHTPGLGPRLRAARLARGWTQRAVGDAVGVHQSLIGHIERGGTAPRAVVAWVEREEEWAALGTGWPV